MTDGSNFGLCHWHNILNHIITRHLKDFGSIQKKCKWQKTVVLIAPNLWCRNQMTIEKVSHYKKLFPDYDSWQETDHFQFGFHPTIDFEEMMI